MWRPSIRILPVLPLLVCSLCAQEKEDNGLLPPSDRSGRAAIIRKLVGSGDLKNAAKHAEVLAEREPNNFEGPFWQGFIHLQSGNHFDAIRALRRAEALDANVTVSKALGVSYYAVRQYRLFLIKMEEALRKSPDDFASYYYLGRYYDSNLTDFDKAAMYFSQALRRNPDHFRSHYHLGYCHEVGQKPVLAEHEYRRASALAAEQGAKYDMPYLGLARLRVAAGKLDEALAPARRAVELVPDSAANRKLLARIYSELGRHVESVREWERSTELDPTDAGALYRLYRAYVTLNEPGKANAALDRFKVIAARYGTN